MISTFLLNLLFLVSLSTGSLDVASTTDRVDQAHKQQSHAEKSAVVGYTQQVCELVH